jgi:GTP-binding protein Era
MSNPTEQPNEAEYDNGQASPIFDDDLPPDHRSGYVAVIGRPNVGKSTLMNHFLGQKIAIVSHKPQTTRNQILGILTIPSTFDPEPIEGCPPAQVIFVDTPGIHQPHHKFGEYLTETAIETIPDADVVVWLVDATEPPTTEDRLVAEVLQEIRATADQRSESIAPV